MKTLHLFAIIFSMVFSSFCFAEQETPLDVTPIQQLKVEEIDFDNLPKESQVGNLAAVVEEEPTLADSLMEKVQKNINIKSFIPIPRC